MLAFRVLPPYASWSVDDQEFSANEPEHQVENPSEALLLAAGHAHTEGVIDVTEGLVTDHVMDFDAWQAAAQEAQGEWVPPTYAEDGTAIPGYWTGPWYEGHLDAQANLAAGRATSDVSVEVS